MEVGSQKLHMAVEEACRRVVTSRNELYPFCEELHSPLIHTDDEETSILCSGPETFLKSNLASSLNSTISPSLAVLPDTITV